MKPRHEMPGELNDVWALDVALTTGYGRQVIMLAVVDLYSRQVLAAEVLSNLTGEDVVGVLSQLVAQRKAPKCLLVGNGRILAEGTISLWAAQHGIQIAHESGHRPSAKGSLERLLWSALKPLKQFSPDDR